MFVTLTYSDDNVPLTPSGRMGLWKRDLQLFFKRLRKAHGKHLHRRIKYYAAGEYGERSGRPHYHIILFNAIPELIECAWQEEGVVLGNIHYGFVSEASVGYTLKYINKPKKRPRRGDDRPPEFALMSKGLGKCYLDDKIRSWHKADIAERMYCNLKDGKKISMPRYYKDKLYTTKERAFAAAVLQDRFRNKEFELQDKCINYMRNKSEAAKAAFRSAKIKSLQPSFNRI